MKSVYLGILLGVLGTLSMSLAMNLWKASAVLEADLPFYCRPRLAIGIVLGVFFNTVLDGFAFAMTPLAMIAPLQGVGIAFTVFFAALGIGGYQESVSVVQWKAIFGAITGLIICAYFGPTPEAELEWWPLYLHFYNPWWIAYAATSYIIASATFIIQRVPAAVARLHGSFAWSLLMCAGAGMLAGLTQTQLKVFAQSMRSLAYSPKISCKGSPPGYCHYDVRARGSHRARPATALCPRTDH